MRIRFLLPVLVALAALPAWAQGKKVDRDHMLRGGDFGTNVARPVDPTQRFVESNILETLYHELGHAIVDVMGLEVFGPEEFAVDFFAALMLDIMHDEPTTKRLIYDVAHGYAAGEEMDRWSGVSTAMWDVHGKPMQRYYNLVCLYFGADPEGRKHAMHDLDLPEFRANTCAEEWEQAHFSWSGVLNELAEGAPARTLVFEWAAEGADDVARFVEAEVDRLNQFIALPEPVSVNVIPCGEVNAFYDPNSHEILICTELAEHLVALAP